MSRQAGSTAEPTPWGRGRLLALLAGMVLALAAVVGGLALAVVSTIGRREQVASTHLSQVAAPPQQITEQQRRDAVAAAPMPTAAASEALPHALSSRPPGEIVLPPATANGAADVPTGFPSTPEGALAQLAAIDVTAMQVASLDGVRQVIDAWAAPGGPTGQTWSGVRGMANLLSATGLSGGGSAQLAVVARPVMGLIKGTVGAEYAVVCVDLELAVTVERTALIAVADCQRMTWTVDRWLIGPGPEPAPAPSVWPGTDLSIAVGFRELSHG